MTTFLLKEYDLALFKIELKRIPLSYIGINNFSIFMSSLTFLGFFLLPKLN